MRQSKIKCSLSMLHALCYVTTHLIKNKISLQTSLEGNSSNFSYISFLGVNFENLIVEFHVPYVLNIHIKFRSNRILFTI